MDLLRDRRDLVAGEVAGGVAGERRRLVLELGVVDAVGGDGDAAEGAHARLVEAGADGGARRGRVERLGGLADAEVVGRRVDSRADRVGGLGGVDDGGLLSHLVGLTVLAQALRVGDELARGAHLRREVGDALGVDLVVVDAAAAVRHLGAVRDGGVDRALRRVDELAGGRDGIYLGRRHRRSPSQASYLFRHARGAFGISTV